MTLYTVRFDSIKLQPRAFKTHWEALVYAWNLYIRFFITDSSYSFTKKDIALDWESLVKDNYIEDFCDIEIFEQSQLDWEYLRGITTTGLKYEDEDDNFQSPEGSGAF